MREKVDTLLGGKHTQASRGTSNRGGKGGRVLDMARVWLAERFA